VTTVPLTELAISLTNNPPVSKAAASGNPRKGNLDPKSISYSCTQVYPARVSILWRIFLASLERAEPWVAARLQAG
jgi:hypothetical protein